MYHISTPLTTSVYGWDSHMTFKNNTPFPLKFHIEAAEDCIANETQSCKAGAMVGIYYNVYICPTVYPFDDNNKLTESDCNLLKYQWNQAEPILLKIANYISQAIEQAEEDGDEDEVEELTAIQNAGSNVQVDQKSGAYVLTWKGDVNGDSTVTANFDTTTGKFSLSS